MTSAIDKAVRLLNDIDRSKHRSQVFADFCELAYCALAKQACPFLDQWDALETQYMDVVGRYRTKDDVRKMPEILALVLAGISKGGRDVLGEIAGSIGALDSKLGQFFSPNEVSRLMAEINLVNVDQMIEEQGFATVSEPAAGAVGMLLALADVIEDKGHCLETSIWIEAVELSRSTFHMCYIQCAARGLAGKIIHGNSLSMDTYSSAYTAAAARFLAANGDPFARQKERVAQWEAEEHTHLSRLEAERNDRRTRMAEGAPIAGEQLSLF